MITAQFINCGTTVSNDLQNLKPTGANTEYNVNIQTLDSHGQTVDSYFWYPGDYLDVPEDDPCWSDEGGSKKLTGVKFGPGTGLWVTGADTTQGLQTSGAVGTSDVSVQLCAGATGIGNPFPVQVDLQDLLPTGEGTEYNVNIQTLDAHGQTVDSYFWYPGDYLDEPEDDPCWSDEGGSKKLTGVKFAPGEGLWVTGSSTSQALVIPAPEL